MSDAQRIIDYGHEEIHEGHHFFHEEDYEVPGESELNFILDVKDENIHFVYSVDSDFAGFTLESYEGVTSDDDGDPVLMINNNRESSNISSLIVRQDETYTAITTEVRIRSASKGTAVNPANSSGGSIQRSNEVILKKNTKYLILITNKSSSANPINVDMSYYEKNIAG